MHQMYVFIIKMFSLFTAFSSMYLLLGTFLIFLLNTRVITPSVEGVENYVLAFLIFPAKFMSDGIGELFHIPWFVFLPLWITGLLGVCIASFSVLKRAK